MTDVETVPVPPLADRAPRPVRVDKPRAFVEADRHTRRVRLLRIALPAIVAVTVVVVGGLSLFNPFHESDIKVDVGALNVSGDKLTMELPRLTGFNRKSQTYNVTAKSAAQHLSAPGIIDLNDLDALITMADKSTANLRATVGRFDSTSEVLSLAKAVTVSSTKGYSARMTSAVVDFKAGSVESKEPVHLTLSNGTVEGNRMMILNGGDNIRFEGGVTSRFETKASRPATDPNQTTKDPGTQP